MRKLFNNKGASMVFALFVFLVCAVICSVIVISVTASSGRFSRMTEADSRYFSVTSAAQLLADELVSASVTVERQKIAVSGASPSTDYVTKLDGDEITALFTGEDMSFLQRAAMYAVFADGSYTGAEAWASEPLSAAAAESYSFTLEHAGAKARRRT